MASYSLHFKKSVARDFRSIPNKDVARILERIDSTAGSPRQVGSEKLSGQNRYRIRQGDYRIMYEIKGDELIVVIVKVGHRKNIYRTQLTE